MGKEGDVNAGDRRPNKAMMPPPLFFLFGSVAAISVSIRVHSLWFFLVGRVVGVLELAARERVNESE
jgi:hypothetical protein